MIAVDTSTLIAYLAGEEAEDIKIMENSLEDGILFFPPPVLSEILSDPILPLELFKVITEIPILPTLEGFWERCGLLRRELLKRKLKARLADSMIAQYCLDNNAPLITRDKDFKNFQKVSELLVL